MSFVTNIQKHCIHDGSGIRTTVFFKGCPLTCQWCQNPENQEFNREIRFFRDRCTGCKRCVATCQKHAFSVTEEGIFFDRSKCVRCGRCVLTCPGQALETIGTSYEVNALIKKLCADQILYEESDGGVTLSGGEVMSVPETYLMTLVKGLYAEGISINIDTCGFCQWSRLEALLPYIDTFLFNLKVLDEEKHLYYTGVSNAGILENLQRLAASGAKIWIRIPVIESVNGDVYFAQAVGHWLRENRINPRQMNLIRYHDYGSDKYEQLGKTYVGETFAAPKEDVLLAMQKALEEMGFVVHIGG